MILLLVQFDRLVQIVKHAVNAPAHIACLGQRLKRFLEFAFPSANDRRQDHHTFAFRESLQMAHDLIGRLLGDRFTALETVRYTNGGKQQPEVVVDFGHGADGRTRAPCGCLLLDRNRRRKPFDGIHVRWFQAIEKLPGVGRKRFDVSALSFGVKRVEGEAGFSGPAQTRNDSEPVAGNFHINALEIVLPGAADRNIFNRMRHLFAISRVWKPPILAHLPHQFPAGSQILVQVFQGDFQLGITPVCGLPIGSGRRVLKGQLQVGQLSLD